MWKLLLNKNYEEHKANFSEFVVIGAGLPKTGTLSLSAALCKILGGACYHMVNIINGTEIEIAHWEHALDNKISDQQWINFLADRGFRAGVDFPVALFYKQLMRVFPEAKVILTVRDPESWYASFDAHFSQLSQIIHSWPVKHVLSLFGGKRKMEILKKVKDYRPEGFGLNLQDVLDANDKDKAIKFYNKWVQDVKDNVPEDRLLIFDVKQGWEPLCNFLGVPPPEQPFPRLNEKKEMTRARNNLRLFAYFVVYVTPLIVAIFLAFLCQDYISFF